MAMQCCILGARDGIIKLHPTGKGLINVEITEHAYLAIRACDNIQAEGEDEDSIVDRTIQH